MLNRKTSAINQSLVDVPTVGLYMGTAAQAQVPDKPSRFQRKKGYTGKTAQACNQNFKTMPKDF